MRKCWCVGANLIDSKKAYLAGIVLAQFRLKRDFSKLIGALRCTADEDTQELLTLSRVQALITILPTDAELAKCSEFKGESSALGEAELFYRVRTGALVVAFIVTSCLTRD